MRPRTIFLDNWAIHNLLEDAETQGYLSTVQTNRICPVASLWNIYEITKDGDLRRANAKADLLDQLKPLWLRLPNLLGGDEVAILFWDFLRFGPTTPPNPFCGDVDSLFAEMAGPFLRHSITAALAVTYIQKKHPELLGEPRLAAKEWIEATKICRAKGRSIEASTDTTMRRIAALRLPHKSPEGLLIDGRSRREFIQSFDWKKSRILQLEAALSREYLSRTEDPTEGDLVDLQCVTSALIHCEAVTTDRHISQLVRQARSHLSFPIAGVINDWKTAAAWIQKNSETRGEAVP